MADVALGNIVATLRIDTSQLAQAMQQAQQALGQLQQRVQSNATQATQAAQSNQQFTQSLNQITQATRQATEAQSSWRRALEVAGGIGLASSLQGLVSTLKDFATETVTVGARMEQLRASLSALAGSVGAGQQQFDQLFQSAQRLGVPFESLARGWRTLTAAATQAGLPLADQRRLLEAIATEGRRVGASNEELSRAFLAMGQMASKGTVSMEELRQQLGEAIPTALAAMAQGMGRTTEELIKLVEAGGVRFPTAARALTRGLEEMQRAGGATGETLQTAFNRFGNELVRSRDELTRMAGPLRTVTELATGFLKVMNDSAQAQRQLREARAGEALIGTGLRQGDVQRLPADQQRRLTQINRLLGEQIMQQGDPNAAPMFQPTREEYIKQLQAERDEILKGAQAIKAKTDEQKAATAEVNKARAAEELQRDTIADLNKQMDAIAKAAQAFRREAAISPELKGREGGTLEEQAQFQQGRAQAVRAELEKLAAAVANIPAGVTLPPETLARVRQLNAEYGGVLKNIEAIDEKQKAAAKAEREAEAERRRLAREAQQDAEEYQAAIDKVTMALARERDQALDTLRRIQSQFSQTRAERTEDTIASLRQRFPEDEAVQAQADLAVAALQTRQAYLEEIDAAQASFAVIRERTKLLVDAEEKQTAFSLSLQQTLERLQTPREQRDSLRLRQQAERQGITLTPDDEATLRRVEAQERLNTYMRLFEELANSVGNAWTNALMSIADGTKTVAEAFREMARSILQSMAQIASQEAFKALIRIGFGLIGSFFGTTGTGAIGGTTSLATGGSSTGYLSSGGGFAFGSGAVPAFQHGGYVNKPTLSILGEAGPEYVVPAQRMQAMQAQMRAGGSSDSGGGVSIHNYPSRAEAERGAARDRAAGRTAIVNEVLSDLNKGESSLIQQVLRKTAR